MMSDRAGVLLVTVCSWVAGERRGSCRLILTRRHDIHGCWPDDGCALKVKRGDSKVQAHGTKSAALEGAAT
jgi:hypothetical protein